MANAISDGKNEVLFIKEESVAGTAEVLTAAEAVHVISSTFTQDRPPTPDAQKRNTIGEVGEKAYFYNTGTFEIKGNIHASGAAGTAPEEGAILEGLFGTETLVSETSATYTQAGIDDSIKTYTIMRRYGHDTYQYTGCVFDVGTFPVKAGASEDALVGYTVTGYYIKCDQAGTDALAAECASSTTLTVDDASKYINTPFIQIGTDNNTGAGHRISSINYTTNVITLTAATATTQAVDAVVKGWTPASTEAGYVMHGRFQSITTSTDGGTTDVTASYAIESTLTYSNNIVHNNDIKSNSEWGLVGAYSWGKRTVEISLDQLAETEASKWNYYAQQETDLEIAVPFGGDGAGKQGSWLASQWRVQPTNFEDGDQITAKLTGKAYETTTYDDAIQMQFT